MIAGTMVVTRLGRGVAETPPASAIDAPQRASLAVLRSDRSIHPTRRRPNLGLGIADAIVTKLADLRSYASADAGSCRWKGARSTPSPSRISYRSAMCSPAPYVDPTMLIASTSADSRHG